MNLGSDNKGPVTVQQTVMPAVNAGEGVGLVAGVNGSMTELKSLRQGGGIVLVDDTAQKEVEIHLDPQVQDKVNEIIAATTNLQTKLADLQNTLTVVNQSSIHNNRELANRFDLQALDVEVWKNNVTGLGVSIDILTDDLSKTEKNLSDKMMAYYKAHEQQILSHGHSIGMILGRLAHPPKLVAYSLTMLALWNIALTISWFMK